MTFSNSLLSSSECTTPPQAVPVITESSCPGPSHLPSYVSPFTTSTPQPQPVVTAVPPLCVSPATAPTTPQPQPVVTAALAPSNVTSAVPVPEHEGALRYISKYLVQYVPVKQSKVSGMGKRAAGARVLTSDECAQILAEREEKKRKEQEEKEKRKSEREQKKKEREEAARRKAEKKKEADRLRAESKRKTNTGSRNTRPRKRSSSSSSSMPSKKKSTGTCPSTSAAFIESESVSSILVETLNPEPVETPNPEPVETPNPEPPSPNNDASSIVDDMDSNQCCVCFEMYDNTTEWVQCVCQRWLHEEFYTDIVLDKYGRELLCPFCVV